MNDKTLHLKFLSLRLLDSPNSHKENSMQRNLQSNVHYYFYSGIEIGDEFITIKKKVSDSLFNGIGINKHNRHLCYCWGKWFREEYYS